MRKHSGKRTKLRTSHGSKITAQQKTYLRTLLRKLGEQPAEGWINGLSRKEASEFITFCKQRSAVS